MTSKSKEKEPLNDDKEPDAKAPAEAAKAKEESSLKRKAAPGPDGSATDSEGSSVSDDEGSPKRPRSETVPLDLAPTLGLKVGDRIEVHWEIEKDNGETYSLWWGAKLLKYDGRTTDSVAIRTIRYDAKPDLGFSSCTDDVIFLGDDLIVTPDSQTQLHYRREGHEEVFWYNEGDLDAHLNSILMGALDKNRDAWKNLSPVQQAVIAEKIAGKKEKLKEALKDRNEVITSAIIKDVLQKAFE